MNNTVKAIIAIAVPQLVAILSGLASAAGTREWYPQIAKPSFTPPSWVFGPVWTLLYLMMGIAAFLVWKRGLEKPGVRFALMVFLIHLAFNGAWSVPNSRVRCSTWRAIRISRSGVERTPSSSRQTRR